MEADDGGNRVRLEKALAAAPPWAGSWDAFAWPSRARVRDVLLGGKDHYAVDRQAVAELADAWPQIAQAAASLRAALHATVAHAVGELGIRQVLVTDYGYPTATTSGPDLHTTAQRATGDGVTVVYLEPDPIAAAHLRAGAHPGTVLRADIAADPVRAVALAADEGGYDPALPVCVLLPEALSRAGDPARILRTLARVLAPGSLLMAAAPPDLAPARHAAALAAHHHMPFHTRTHDQLRALLAGAGLRPSPGTGRDQGACLVTALVGGEHG
ncbi:SAM-dependent methyltransferase [Streptomyces sp. NPDC049881]|uniref:SAM-dependent methyltransferase n=1 Tax=Streptomyces sp. NPDC049881 TaxID=3155778 RepID=UPI003435BA7C